MCGPSHLRSRPRPTWSSPGPMRFAGDSRHAKNVGALRGVGLTTMRFLENTCTIMVRLQRVLCRALQSGQRTTAIARPTMVSPTHPHARVGLQRLDLATDGAVGDVELQRGAWVKLWCRAAAAKAWTAFSGGRRDGRAGDFQTRASPPNRLPGYGGLASRWSAAARCACGRRCLRRRGVNCQPDQTIKAVMVRAMR